MTTVPVSAWSALWSALTTGHVRDAVDSLLAAKVAAKNLFAAHHLSPLWVVIRDHVLNRDVWLLAFIPALLLELVLPAEEPSPDRNAELWLDFSYPVFVAIFAAPFVAIFVSGIEGFYRTHLPFLNTGILDGKPIWLQALGVFLITDFTLFLSHLIRHKVRWFWYFHAIHHSQEDLNPMTTDRTHFFEAVINTTIRFIPVAFVGGSPISWTIFVVLNSFWGYFIHSNVRTNLGPLKYVIVSPQFHRVHHSKLPEHWDKNFGERLILWDWMFGTLHPDFECYPPTGVASMDRWAVTPGRGPLGMAAAWFRQNAYPFVAIGRSIRAWVTGVPVTYPEAYAVLTDTSLNKLGEREASEAAQV